MPFIEIFLPTGHREKVEINANTTLITVLEDVCIKRGLQFDNCYLNYNKTKVDLSAKFGQSRLLNNAKLDLVESTKSLIENSTVDVALQLEASSRVNQSFFPKESLYSILESLSKLQDELKSCIFPENSDLIPVIFHLHDQIVGEYCLKNTTLASLGLRSGRVLFRLEFKKFNDNEKSKFEEATRMRIEKYLMGETIRHKKEETKSVEDVDSYASIPPAAQSTSFTTQPEPMNTQTMAFDDFVPFSTFSTTNKSMFDNDTKKSTPKVPQIQSQSLGELLGIHLETDSQQSNYIPETENFLNFKFPEKSNDNGQLDDNRNDDQMEGICTEDRETVLYHRKTVVNHTHSADSNSTEDLSDTFFELTQQDLHNIIQSYRNVAESHNPLMTNTLREQMREARFAKYRRCIIQFHFPDAYILQSVFKPRETVGDLYNFVRQFFGNRNSNFNLYTSPPKENLKTMDKNLIQAGLAPMCKIYVSITARDLSGNIDNYLSGDEVKAREIIEKWMKTENNDDVIRTPGASKPGSGNSHKIPKWFKPGK